MARPLLCGQCGGPLPRPDAAARFVTCRFCGTTSDLETGSRTAGAAPQASPSEGFRQELDAFRAAYAQRTDRGEAPLAAFRAAAEIAFSAAWDPEAMTNVVFGIAADFEAQTGVDVTVDPVVVPRLANAYLLATSELRTQPSYDLNMPFLTATKDGPLHFRQTLTIQRLSELAEKAPTKKRAAAAPGGASAPPDAPRAPWWRKLFG